MSRGVLGCADRAFLWCLFEISLLSIFPVYFHLGENVSQFWCTGWGRVCLQTICLSRLIWIHRLLCFPVCPTRSHKLKIAGKIEYRSILNSSNLFCSCTQKIFIGCLLYARQSSGYWYYNWEQRWKYEPWLVWLSGLSTSLQTKGSLVRFPVRAHAWVVGQVPGKGCTRSNHLFKFLSHSFSLPSPLKINK